MALSTGNPFLNAIGGDVWPEDGPNGKNYTPPPAHTLVLSVFFDQDTSAGHSTGGVWTGDEQAAFWNALQPGRMSPTSTSLRPITQTPRTLLCASKKVQTLGQMGQMFSGK